MTALGRIDRYELIELLGQGSFGGVYRSRHVHTGQIVALKLVRAADPDAAGRLLVEGRAASSLRHPNVVGILDGGLTETGDAFIIMELLAGETLAQLLTREDRLPAARAVPIALAILDALAAAHTSGIVHRDVKPSNIFLSPGPNGGDHVKVIDFGISKLRMPGATSGSVFTLPGVAMGTPGYMAPEQLGDARSVDARADVYSVGATLFELLSGRKPHLFDSFEAWMKKLTTEPAPPLASLAPVSATLGAVVDRALARDRDARWASAAAMREALEGAFAQVITPETRPSLPQAPSPSAPSPSEIGRGAWVFAIAGVTLAVVSVIAVTAFLIGRAGTSHPDPMPIPTASVAPPPSARKNVPAPSADDDDETPPAPAIPDKKPREDRDRTPHGIGF